MIKRFLLLALVIFSVSPLRAQTTFLRDTTEQKLALRLYPEQKINVSWVASDAVANFFSLEGQYRLNRNAFIFGLSSGLGLYDVSGDDFETENLPITGFQIKGNHKYYIGRQSERVFFSVVHGPAFQQYNIDYEGEVFQPFIEDGITYYRPENTELQFRVNRFVYDARVQYEYIDNFFFVECGFGFSYRGVLSEENKPANWNTDGLVQGITFSGIRPSIQVKFGIYFDGKGYASDYQK